MQCNVSIVIMAIHATPEYDIRSNRSSFGGLSCRKKDKSREQPSVKRMMCPFGMQFHILLNDTVHDRVRVLEILRLDSIRFVRDSIGGNWISSG